MPRLAEPAGSQREQHFLRLLKSEDPVPTERDRLRGTNSQPAKKTGRSPVPSRPGAQGQRPQHKLAESRELLRNSAAPGTKQQSGARKERAQSRAGADEGIL